jgi:hypothetical protein
MKRVVVHIDRLILKGLGNTNPHAIGEGMQGELARLVADPTAAKRLASLGNVSSLNTAKISFALGGRPQRLGMSAGRAIVRGLSQ